MTSFCLRFRMLTSILISPKPSCSTMSLNNVSSFSVAGVNSVCWFSVVMMFVGFGYGLGMHSSCE